MCSTTRNESSKFTTLTSVAATPLWCVPNGAVSQCWFFARVHGSEMFASLFGCLAGVVYCIPCQTCSDIYIGQTGRLLKTRIDEHKAAVKYAKSDVSAVAEHVWVQKHLVDFQSVSILAREQNLHQRLSLESWFIRKCSTFNREKGTLMPVYDLL